MSKSRKRQTQEDEVVLENETSISSIIILIEGDKSDIIVDYTLKDAPQIARTLALLTTGKLNNSIRACLENGDKSYGQYIWSLVEAELGEDAVCPTQVTRPIDDN